MRVSSTGMVSSYLQQLQRSYNNYTKLMEQSDGSKLHRPSDGAVPYSKYLRHKNTAAENEQYQTNVKTAISWMKNSDSAMVDIADCLATNVEKAVQAGNSTNGEKDMQAIAQEMLAMTQQAVSDANTQVADRYLFSGQKDTTQPYSFSPTKADRGLAKSLDDGQSAFFYDADSSGSGGISQMLTLQVKNADGTLDPSQTYYLNTRTGKVYSKEFMDSGYKDLVALGQSEVKDTDAVDEIDKFVPDGAGNYDKQVSDYFDGTGVINADGKAAEFEITNGAGEKVKLGFATISQYIVTYNGDGQKISMVKENGAVQPASDTVNITGYEMAGSSIFDDANSGNEQSGTACFNDMLTVVAIAESGDNKLMSSDGITLANNSYNTVNNAETKLAARQQVYNAVQGMLEKQSTQITSDISDVADTDVAQLAIDMMSAQTIYNLSLSVGARILPKSLVDYL